MPPANNFNNFSNTDELLFFPGTAYQGLDSNWYVEIHGWIYSYHHLQPISKFQKLMQSLFKKIPGQFSVSGSESASLLKTRLKWFATGNQSGRALTIQLSGCEYLLAASNANGHFRSIIKVPENALRLNSNGTSIIPFNLVATGQEHASISGSIYFLAPHGLTIISDIDDTIKQSDVNNKFKLLRNTFSKPFTAVPGMAKLYQQWLTNYEAHFHYLTASPWQLYKPIVDFLATKKFPAGTFNMKHFRYKDRSFFKIFQNSITFKTLAIENFIQRYPQRSLLLIGDSGENDLEIYTRIAKKFPLNVKAILIRDTGHVASSNDKPSCPVHIFSHASDLQSMEIGDL